MIACAVGHRTIQKSPDKKSYISKLEYLGAPRNSKVLRNRLIDLGTAWLVAHPEVRTVVSDLTPGWNIALAEAAFKLDLEHRIYIPHTAHVHKVKTPWWNMYHNLIETAAFVCAPPVPYNVNAVAENTKRLITVSNIVVALWDGEEDDEPNYLIKVAKKKKKPVTNLWKTWLKYQQEGGDAL